MKRNYHVLLFAICFTILSCAKKNLDYQKSEDNVQSSFWNGAYGDRNGNYLSYDKPFSILLKGNGVALIYTGSHDTTQSLKSEGSYELKGKNLSLNYLNSKTKENFLLIGSMEEKRIEGKWTNEAKAGVFFIDTH